jgi:hypothetical protein
MGSILRLPIVHIGDLNAFIKRCKRRIQIVATVLTGEKAPSTSSYQADGCGPGTEEAACRRTPWIMSTFASAFP